MYVGATIDLLVKMICFLEFDGNFHTFCRSKLYHSLDI